MSFFDAIGIAAAAGKAINKFLDSVSEVGNNLGDDDLAKGAGFADLDKATATEEIELLGLIESTLSCDADTAEGTVEDDGEGDGSLFELEKLLPSELLAEGFEDTPNAFDSELPDFCHPNDRSALAKMKSVPGFTKVMSVYAKHFSDRERHLEFMSNSLRVGPKQCPEIYAPVSQICTFFGIDTPEVFVANTSNARAFCQRGQPTSISDYHRLIGCGRTERIRSCLSAGMCPYFLQAYVVSFIWKSPYFWDSPSYFG